MCPSQGYKFNPYNSISSTKLVCFEPMKIMSYGKAALSVSREWENLTLCKKKTLMFHDIHIL